MSYRCCANPQALLTLFAEPPAFDPVALHEATLHRDGPLLRLRFDLPTFPDRPPPRWPSDANTAQVVLDLWGVADLMLHGWEPAPSGALTLERLPDGILAAAFTSAHTRLTCRARLARISSVSGYLSEERD